MVNYYEILGLEPTCTVGDIKRSFRKKAKELHPDLTKTNRQVSDDQMRALLDAYETLINPEKRSDYDRSFATYFRKSRFNYREYLRGRKDDLYCRSRLIFYDLLNSEHEEAISLFDDLTARSEEYSLEYYLGHEDYMDCLFLMAEALEKKGEYVRACELYKNVCLLELKQPYFHHFMDEVVERLRSITCFKMVSCLPPHVSVKYIKDMIRFNFSRKDNAFFYKKIAEIYCSLGRRDLAIEYLNKGLELDQKLPGVKKLKEKIGYSEIPVA